MPLLDGPRNRDGANSVVHFEVSSPSHEDSTGLDVRSNGERRQRIVVVGLGMVAISFMYVDDRDGEEPLFNADILKAKRSLNKTLRGGSTTSWSLARNPTWLTIVSASRRSSNTARLKTCT